MIESGRIYVSISLTFLTMALIFHLVAMGYPRWKIYEHRSKPSQTMYFGVFHRCENHIINVTSNGTEIYPICNDNKYYSSASHDCKMLDNTSPYSIHYICNINDTSTNCDYSSVGKGLMSCTIIAACTLGISLILIFTHILINQFKYKTHIYLSGITIILLSLGFIFIFITLVLLGGTMSYDLKKYRCYLVKNFNERSNRLKSVYRSKSVSGVLDDYDIRLDWAAGLEILALILSSFTLFTQIIYTFSTRRNRIG